MLPVALSLPFTQIPLRHPAPPPSRSFAYVPASDLVSIVTTRVRVHLSKQLSSHARAWPALREEESDRLAAFLETLASQ